MVKLLPYILLAIAFVILLLTLYPYYQLKIIKSQGYSCPASDWVDCMPGPGIPKVQCQPEYLQWATNNCPNFRGAAL